MVFQPNYRFKKAQRQRVKKSRKESQSTDDEAHPAQEARTVQADTDTSANDEREQADPA